MSKRVYKIGDKVRILRPRLIRRVGYPLYWWEMRGAAAAHLKQVPFHLLGVSSRPDQYKDLVRGLAKALVISNGFGGNERSIHYYPISEPVPDDMLWSIGMVQDEESYDLPTMPDPTGKECHVDGKYVRKTGIRIPSYYGYDGEWESGYLKNEQTHVILKTCYGDIEDCDVEYVGGFLDDPR